MKCFCHSSVDAVATCLDCGKGMCSDCSAYSGHSGICPACRKEGFEREVSLKRAQIKECTSSIVWTVILGILFCWTVVALLIAGISIAVKVKQKKKLQDRIDALLVEIDKIEKVYLQHTGRAFI